MIGRIRSLYHRKYGYRHGGLRPYPVNVTRVKSVVPDDPARFEFEKPHYIEINAARLEHLASLNLPIDGRTVIDVGCGIGQLAPFFLERNCALTCVDARPGNIAELKKRLPQVQAQVIENVETDPLAQFGRFDVVFAYGLLYHLESPVAGLRNLASVCKDLLILETMVCDYPQSVLRLETEGYESVQAIAGLGSRPSPSYIVHALERMGFEHIYAPRTRPRHPDFNFSWRGDMSWKRKGHYLRCIFVASRNQLDTRTLAPLI